MCADLFISTGAKPIDAPMKDFHLKQVSLLAYTGQLLVRKPCQCTHTFEENFFEMLWVLFIFHLQ